MLNSVLFSLGGIKTVFLMNIFIYKCFAHVCVKTPHEILRSGMYVFAILTESQISSLGVIS